MSWLSEGVRWVKKIDPDDRNHFDYSCYVDGRYKGMVCEDNRRIMAVIHMQESRHDTVPQAMKFVEEYKEC